PNKGKYPFTSESVTEGHPDKVADQISDAILDVILSQDKNARVACETLVTTGLAFIAGEITTTGYADFPSVVRETNKDIGYNHYDMGLTWWTCSVISYIEKQSADIAQGVDCDDTESLGAADKGMMFRFASDESETSLPAPMYLTHKPSRRLAYVRKEGILDFLRPQGMNEVLFLDGDGRHKKIDTVVVDTQH
ncbi:methionine adenosyltransferase, partial [Oceanidesulfovibrio marinus]